MIRFVRSGLPPLPPDSLRAQFHPPLEEAQQGSGSPPGAFFCCFITVLVFYIGQACANPDYS